MNRAFLPRIVGTLALAIATPAVGSVTVDVGEGPFLVGDPVPVVVSFPVPAGQAPTPPLWSETWGEAEIREVGPLEVSPVGPSTTIATQRLQITFFRSGNFQLPMPAFPGLDQAHGETDSGAPPIAVEVQSMLPDGDEIPPPRPPAAPARIPLGRAFFTIAASLAFLALAAIAALVFRARYAAEGSSATAEDPLTALRRALEGLANNGDLDQVFTGVSLHLRQFLARTMAFPAVESTTSEIRRHLRRQDLPAEITMRTERLLHQCDGVKFARRDASAIDASASLEEAETIGTQTMDSLARLKAAEEASPE